MALTGDIPICTFPNHCHHAPEPTGPDPLAALRVAEAALVALDVEGTACIRWRDWVEGRRDELRTCENTGSEPCRACHARDALATVRAALAAVDRAVPRS